MFKVIACMAAGMVLGRFLRLKGLQKPIIAVTWLLLLLLGWETGSDREVIGALPSIGLASAALSIGGVAGSCILAWMLWKYMGGNVGEAVPEAGQGARETGAGGDLQAVSGRELQTVSGLDMGTGRRISVWSGMGGSLVILGFFTLGIILGLAGLPAGQSIVHKLSFWSLCILMAMVGMSVGGNPELVSSIRSMNPRIALLPIATILGTYAGCIIVNLFLGHSIADVLAIGSGFGYYSLSSVLISSSRGPHLGSIALISNIIREVFTLLCAPFLARIAGPLAPISSGGATTADTTLPIISSCCGDKFVLISIFHGFVVDFSVPLLVSLFCTLGA